MSNIAEKSRIRLSSQTLKPIFSIKNISARFLVFLMIYISTAHSSLNSCSLLFSKIQAELSFKGLKEILVHNSKMVNASEQITKVNDIALATFQKLYPGTKNLLEILDDPSIHLRQHVDLPRVSFQQISKLLQEQNIPREMIDNFALLNIKGKRFADGKDHFGQILVHKLAVHDTLKFFEILYKNDVPIGPIVPAQLFGGNDSIMVAANITSGANLRTVEGSLKNKDEISFHSYGIAIDVNPKLNRWQKNPQLDPLLDYGYDPSVIGTMVANSKVINEIEDQTGFRWGGYWKHPDPQHFTHTTISRLLNIKEIDD